MPSIPVIAIDGPSASGKGTVAARVAKALGFHYLDSGALYRLVTLAALRSGTDLGDEAALARVAGAMDVAFHGDSIWLEGDDVAVDMRTEEVGAAASRVAAHPGVREVLLRGRRRARHGLDRVPGRPSEGVSHRQ